MSDARHADIDAELARSDRCLRAARVLLAEGLHEDAESRLYYAAYHAAVAVLLTEGLEAKTHGGVHRLLVQHFVKSGRLGVEDGRILARLQTYRVEADYGRHVALSEEAVTSDLADCETFVAHARGVIAAARVEPA